MELLKKFIKIDDSEKNKGPSSWFILLCVGLILFFLSSTKFNIHNDTEKNNILTSDKVQYQQQSYEAEMEKRLKDILSAVNGAGNVEVMITISYGKELVLADDTSLEQNTAQEKDNAGGTRDTKNYTQEKKTVMKNNSEPIVIKEIEPKIEGIIIVAEGGDNTIVQNNLRKAAQALFNIPAHKIEIFKMK